MLSVVVVFTGLGVVSLQEEKAISKTELITEMNNWFIAGVVSGAEINEFYQSVGDKNLEGPARPLTKLRQAQPGDTIGKF